MKFRAFVLAALVAGCGPVGLYYKPGVTLDRVERDKLACTLAAERQVPVRNVTQMIPGHWRPGRRICDANGTCHVRPGHMTPPRLITEDANLSLRNQVAQQCMADLGYARIALPPCPPAVVEATPPARTVTLPRLTEQSCVIRRGQGQIQIVNPG